MAEESFYISNNERLSLITGVRGSPKIRQFENESGATIRVEYERNAATIKISGNSSQRGEAKVLIKDILEKTSFIPTVSYFVLGESGLNNNKLKFVESDEESPNRRTRYSVKFLNNEDTEIEEVDVINYRIEEFLQLNPCQFNTFDKIDDCLDILSTKLNSNARRRSTNSLFSEQVILKPRIFFGKVLFSEIVNPEDPFTLQEWYRFNIISGRGRRESINSDDVGSHRNGKKVNVEFQQDSHQLYDDFKILQQKFGFKVDHKRIDQDKGSIYIYYTPSSNKKRKLKLSWNEEENKWKIVNHSHNINRLANIDIVSGSRVPDFRLSLKTHYSLSSEGSKVEEIINKIQLAQDFTERDGMWFKSSDFTDTLMQKAVIRQVIDKKRFRNENYHITFSSIRHCDINNITTTQKLITLKHHTWNQDISLDHVEGFMNNVVDTLHYVQEMMATLV
ncbi:hypothetical protein C1645_791298 [Glomus cerebriforme]|uniref:K Homology domain-containing protein n=1 Tax=Glomus cerebriforme TaxID=658196 RepID=A0A397S8E0_9GLOM|nr:hypothetical protein C1645_791298 [Glomus cerebriforme]